MQDESGNKYEFGKVVHTFSLQDGGLFIKSTNITNEMIAPVISLFASFVRHNDDKEIYTDYNSPVYDVMPSLFIDFANGSRAGSGFRLLKRCL